MVGQGGNILGQHGYRAVLVGSPANLRYFVGWALPMPSLELAPGFHLTLAIIDLQNDTRVLIASASDIGSLAGFDDRGEGLWLFLYGANTVGIDPPDQRVPVTDPQASAFARLLRQAVFFDSPLQAVLEAMHRLDIQLEQLGVETSAIPFSLLDALRTVIGARGFHDVSPLLRQLRAIKTPQEVASIGRATQIVETAIRESIGIVKAGTTEREMAQVLCQSVFAQGAVPTLWYVGVGDRAALVDREPGERAVRPGDLIMFDVGCRWQGYYSDVARTFIFGRPAPEIRFYYDVIRQAQNAAVEATRDGAPVSTVFDRAVSTAREKGIPHYARRHCGHGIGLDPYDEPLITPESAHVLREGMVVCIETPYYHVGVGGFQLEDTLVVTGTGVRFLTTLSRELVAL